MVLYCFFLFKQKTAYEMRISDWSSDVCSSDLGDPRETIGLRLGAAILVMKMKTARTTVCFLVSLGNRPNERGVWHEGIASDRRRRRPGARARAVSVAAARSRTGARGNARRGRKIGRASCRERMCQYV